MSTWRMTREPDDGEAIRLLMVRVGDKSLRRGGVREPVLAFAQNPKNDRAASDKYTRKNTARIAVNMTIANATKTAASHDGVTDPLDLTNSVCRLTIILITHASRT